jgi:Na+/glutamate symporter
MKFSIIECFFIVMLIMVIGELVSSKTKAFIPSVFVSAVLFLIGFWTILPKDIVAQASFGPNFVSVTMSLLLVHLGTLMSLRKLIDQWKSVTVSIAGVCGIMLLTLTVGKAMFGWSIVVAATPPLTGGIVAALLMSEAIKAKGMLELSVLPIAMYILHGFVGYPLTSYCLKKESKRLLTEYRKDGANETLLKNSNEIAASHEEAQRKKLIPPLPEKYQTTYIILLKIMVVALLANFVSNLTHQAVNQYVICLIFGVIFCEIGFLEETALVKAGVFGWLITGLMAYVFSGLSSVTPLALSKMILPLIVLILLGVLGMFVMSMIVSKFMGLTKEMGFACALTALFGFPADYILTHEACKSVCKTDEETDYILDIILPKMLVGGFTTVSIASVVIAGIFVKLL